MARQLPLHVNRECTAHLPAAAIIAGPLRASRAAVAAHGAAIAAARERGLVCAAKLLTSSLTEEANTTRRLAPMAAEISSQ